MKTTLLIRLMLMIIIAGTILPFDAAAQIIDEKEVAPSVLDLFNRKFRRSTDPVWEMKGDNYGVSFLFKNQKVYAEFDREGKMTVQRTEVSLNQLRPNTQDYLRKKHRSLELQKAEYVQEIPNKKYYYIEMIPKRYRDPSDIPVTRLYFSSTGIFQSMSDGSSVAPEEVQDVLEVPQEVLREFNRRIKRANEVEWMDVDTAYRADFKSGNNNAYALFSPEGPWIKTSIKLKTKFKGLHPGIRRYFDENMDDFTFMYAEDVSEAPREKYFNVVIIDKTDDPPSDEELLPTNLHFTKSGKHFATIFPEYGVDPIKITRDKRWERTANEKELTSVGEGFGEKDVDRRDLPTKAQEFLNHNYDHEWRTQTCRAIEDEIYGVIYYVVMKKQGQNLEDEHLFDIHGNLIEEED